jgi:hypothetical protein
VIALHFLNSPAGAGAVQEMKRRLCPEAKFKKWGVQAALRLYGDPPTHDLLLCEHCRTTLRAVTLPTAPRKSARRVSLGDARERGCGARSRRATERAQDEFIGRLERYRCGGQWEIIFKDHQEYVFPNLQRSAFGAAGSRTEFQRLYNFACLMRFLPAVVLFCS